MNDDVIPLSKISKIGTVKVYTQAYVDKLEKENAELKDDNKVMADNYSKAKELLKDTLLMAQVEGLKGRYETVDEIEQFLKEE